MSWCTHSPASYDTEKLFMFCSTEKDRGREREEIRVERMKKKHTHKRQQIIINHFCHLEPIEKIETYRCTKSPKKKLQIKLKKKQQTEYDS